MLTVEMRQAETHGAVSRWSGTPPAPAGPCRPRSCHHGNRGRSSQEGDHGCAGRDDLTPLQGRRVCAGRGRRRRPPAHAPRGLRPRAHGCGTSATLGCPIAIDANPNGGYIGPIAWRRHIGTMTQPPLGLNGRDGIETQGSGMAATLGWRTQSLWDRESARRPSWRSSSCPGAPAPPSPHPSEPRPAGGGTRDTERVHGDG